MVRNQRDDTKDTFTVTNWNDAPSLNCDANDDLLTADTLGTLIKILIENGVIQGSVSA